MNGNRERMWLDTLSDEERDRALRLMDMPVGMAIAFVDRDLRTELRSIREERSGGPSKTGLTALVTAVALALYEARKMIGG